MHSHHLTALAALFGLLSALQWACGNPGRGRGPVTDATLGDADASPSDVDVTPTPDVTQPPDGGGGGEDPCAGETPSGRCVGNAIRFCAVASGSSPASVATFQCSPDERCEQTPNGARCVLSAACLTGATECRGQTLATCEGGAWRERVCGNGCISNALGASCTSSGRTERYEGTLTYEFRAPNDGLTDWQPAPTQVLAPGFLVLSFADGMLIDSAVTSTDPQSLGTFALQAVPADEVDGDDYLVAVAMRAGPNQDIQYFVGDPGLGAGSHDVGGALPDAGVWQWSWTPAAIRSPAEVNIPVEAGSGAAFVFDYLRYVYDFAIGFYGQRANSPLAVWLGLGATWSCGACFAPWPVDVFGGTRIANQVWLGAGMDEGYWSGPVVAHELGHYVMGAYGRLPGEGGTHFIGVPSHPGLSWSEGFATWFSSLTRASPIYYDKQNGGFFWMDIDRRAYSSTLPQWERPRSDLGLFQLIDENEVSAMLWALTNDNNLLSMLGALAAPRMVQPPFGRGYTRRIWEALDDRGLPFPFFNSNESAPFLADYLDTILCGGIHTAQAIDQVTEPWDHFPYPSAQPICQVGSGFGFCGRIPLEVACETRAASGGALGQGDPITELSCALSWRIPVERPFEIDLTLPLGAELIEAPPLLIDARGVASGTETLRWRYRGGSGAPAEARIRTGGPSWGYAWRGPAQGSPPRAPVADGPRLRVLGRDLGPSVPLHR